MKNGYLTAAVASSLPDLASDDAFAIDLIDADLDAVAGGALSACGVMSVDCKGTFKSGREAE